MSAEIKNDSPQISVEEFVENSPAELEIRVLAGENGLTTRFITSERIQKIGLALAGFSNYIRAGRIQIVGQSEIAYLSQLDGARKAEALGNLDFTKICCVLASKNLEPPAELIAECDSENVPLLQTPLVSSKTIGIVTGFLQGKLAPQMTMHGVLLGIYGIGVLISGDSGIGKSECALDLITRGHSLISDDAVTIKKIGSRLEGSSPELTFGHIEIRGLGILNIRDLFGVSAIGETKKIELCIKLKRWKEAENIERVGLDLQEEKIFGVKIPQVVLPVGAGRNISTLVETAVRVHLLRRGGYDAAQLLVAKHSALLGANVQ